MAITESNILVSADKNSLTIPTDLTIGGLQTSKLVATNVDKKLVSASNTAAELATTVAASHTRSHALDSTSDHGVGSLTAKYFTRLAADGTKLVSGNICEGSSGQIGIGVANPVADFEVKGTTVFNEDGADYDFRHEGDTDANLFFIDASADKVGIGISVPGSKLHVVNTNAGGYASGLMIDNDSDTINSEIGIDFNVSSNDTTSGDVARISGIRTASGPNGSLIFSTSNSGTLAEQMRLTNTGLGISTDTPTGKLDIYVPVYSTPNSIVFSLDDYNETDEVFAYIKSNNPEGLATGGLLLFSQSKVACVSTAPGLTIQGDLYESDPIDTRAAIRLLVTKNNKVSALASTETAFELINLSTSLVKIRGDGYIDISGEVTAPYFNGSYNLIDNNGDIAGLLNGDGTTVYLNARGPNNSTVGQIELRGYSANNSVQRTHMILKTNTINIPSLPTSSAGLSAGDIWIDTTASNVLKIVT